MSEQSHQPVKMVPWKQWVMVTAMIWPLSIFVPEAIRALLWLPETQWETVMFQGLNAAIIVAILVFVLLPRVVVLCSGWLFKR